MCPLGPDKQDALIALQMITVWRAAESFQLKYPLELCVTLRKFSPQLMTLSINDFNDSYRMPMIS